jgi:negative regulator of genetic competence, sporulation and motility
VAGQWFSPGTPFSSNNKTDHHDITEILLKVALNTIIQIKPTCGFYSMYKYLYLTQDMYYLCIFDVQKKIDSKTSFD